MSKVDTRLLEIFQTYFDTTESEYQRCAISEIKKLFGYEENPKTLEERRDAFIKSLEPYLEEYGKDMINAFYRYWCAKGEKDRKWHFEKQKTWDLARRLDYWKRNQQKFSIASIITRKLNN